MTTHRNWHIVNSGGNAHPYTFFRLVNHLTIMCSFLPPGKLPLEILSGLLRNCTAEDERVLVGPEVGEDAAVIDFGKTCLVVKTDPITFATDEIGHYAVHVNANDVATMGAVPRWFLATLLLPENQTHETLVRTIFDSLQPRNT